MCPQLHAEPSFPARLSDAAVSKGSRPRGLRRRLLSCLHPAVLGPRGPAEGPARTLPHSAPGVELPQSSPWHKAWHGSSLLGRCPQEVPAGARRSEGGREGQAATADRGLSPPGAWRCCPPPRPRARALGSFCPSLAGADSRGDDAPHCAQKHRPCTQGQSGRVPGFSRTAPSPPPSPSALGSCPLRCCRDLAEEMVRVRRGAEASQGRPAGPVALVCHWPKLLQTSERGRPLLLT